MKKKEEEEEVGGGRRKMGWKKKRNLGFFHNLPYTRIIPSQISSFLIERERSVAVSYVYGTYTHTPHWFLYRLYKGSNVCVYIPVPDSPRDGSVAHRPPSCLHHSHWRARLSPPLFSSLTSALSLVGVETVSELFEIDAVKFV